MQVDRLIVQNLRNLANVRLENLGTVNLIHGANGAGKTSLLEAVHLICEGRSFRHGSIHPLVAKGSAECSVFGELSGFHGLARHTVGVSKRPGGHSEIRLDRDREISGLELAGLGAVQVLAQEHGDLFEGGAETRRRFIDWGLFHVEHRFLEVWRRFQAALRQRNSLLRRGRIPAAELKAWDREFISASVELHELRKQHVTRLIERVPSTLASLVGDRFEVQLAYSSGWEARQSLEDALADRVDRDLERGFTSCGPQRADLRISCGLGAATTMLSRGQKKLVGWGLRISHTQLMAEGSEKKAIYLVDDLHAELDGRNARKIASLLEQTGAQCFVTSAMDPGNDPCVEAYQNPRLFHVEHGKVETQ